MIRKKLSSFKIELFEMFPNRAITSTSKAFGLKRTRQREGAQSNKLSRLFSSVSVKIFSKEQAFCFSYLGLDEAGHDLHPENQRNSDSPFTHMLRPPAEMSPDTFAKQLRYNDLASMVVRRGNNAKGIAGKSKSQAKQRYRCEGRTEC